MAPRPAATWRPRRACFVRRFASLRRPAPLGGRVILLLFCICQMDQKQFHSIVDLPDSMDVDEFLIKLETDEDENIPGHQDPLHPPDNSSVEPETFPGPMWEPKREPVFDSTYNEPSFGVPQLTVPAPVIIPKIEPDMVDNFLPSPEIVSDTLENYSDPLGVVSDYPTEDSTMMSLPGPSIQTSTEKTWKITPTDQCDKPKKGSCHKAPKYCCVVGCGASTALCEGLAIFKLPFRMYRRSLWLKNINRMDLINKPINELHVCERHFKKSDFLSHKGTKLKQLANNAVPTAILPDEQKVHKGVQAIRIKFNNDNQTDYTNMETKAIQVNLGEPATFQNKEIKKLIAECKKQLRSIENGAHKTQIHAFNNWCDRFLPDRLAEIIKGQATLKFSNTGNRYDMASKALSLHVFYTSKQAYDLLCKDLCLPRSLSLKRIDIPVSTKYNEDIMRALKIKIDNMSEREKYCSVIIDFMKIRAFLSYYVKKDRIDGFHDVNGCQSMEPAQYALVIFARGLFVNWSQPIAFAFISETKRYSQVSEWIDLYLTKLLDIGLKIKTFIPNFKSDLLNEAQQRSISVDKPYFFINDIKIYYMFDVPDMLKELRDTFLNYRFHFRKGNDAGIADVKHVNELLQQDLKEKLRLAPKLTSSHLDPLDTSQNQVRRAAQLLSRSVATALDMLIDFNRVGDRSGKDTVYFLLLINNLFDALNSSSVKGQQYKRAYCGDETQVDLLQKSLEFFQTLQFTEKGEKTCKPKFTVGFQITIKSILLLFEDLKAEGHEHLFTRYLHLEVSKKFFKAIKRSTAGFVVPRSKQFLDIFRELYLTCLLKSPKQRNCSRDLAKFTIELIETGGKLLDKNSVNNKKEEPLADLPQSIFQSVPDANALFVELKISQEYNLIDICKTLLKWCVKHHDNCNGLKVFVDSFNVAYGSRAINEWALENLETISPVYFATFVENMEIEFCAAFEALESKINVGLAAYERIKDLGFEPPCSCFPTNYLKALFIRLRIYMIVNYNSEVYRQNNFVGESVVFPRVTFIYA